MMIEQMMNNLEIVLFYYLIVMLFPVLGCIAEKVIDKKEKKTCKLMKK